MLVCMKRDRLEVRNAIVNLLIEHGADVNVVDDVRTVERVQINLSYYIEADVHFIHAQCTVQCTVLYIHPSYYVFCYLYQQYGYSAVLSAVDNDVKSAAEILIRHGANLELKAGWVM